MRRKPILAAAGLVLAAFGLGTWLGTRIRPPRAYPGAGPGSVFSPPLPAPATSGSAPPCVDIRHAGQLVGKDGCVTGLVLRVFSARTGNTFLDFCENYRTCPFSSVIFASDKEKFGDLRSLQGRRVEIRGDVVDYEGHAEIVIRDPQQVRSAP